MFHLQIRTLYMELTFTNNSSEFRAESHFNLHLENAGRAKLYKRTSGTGWDYMTDLTIDVEFKNYTYSETDELIPVEEEKESNE